jgi:hypothetical protein
VFQRVSIAAGLVGAAFIGGLIGAACSGESDAQEGDQQVLNAALAIRTLDEAGFHDVEDSIADGEIPADARTVALKMEAIVAATDWPGDLSDQADELAGALNAAAAAYEGEDAQAALPAAERVHDLEHDFSAEAWAWIGEQTDVDGLAHEGEGGE